MTSEPMSYPNQFIEAYLKFYTILLFCVVCVYVCAKECTFNQSITIGYTVLSDMKYPVLPSVFYKHQILYKGGRMETYYLLQVQEYTLRFLLLMKSHDGFR